MIPYLRGRLHMTKVAILDDHAHSAFEVADWSSVKEKPR